MREDGTIKKVETLEKYARDEFDCSMTQLALAWCVKNSNVTTVLLGATKPDQLEENLSCLKVVPQLTKEHLARIDEIMNNKPPQYLGYGGGGMRDLQTI